MVVDAVMMLDDLLPLKMIGVKKVQGGALEVRWSCALDLKEFLHIHKGNQHIQTRKNDFIKTICKIIRTNANQCLQDYYCYRQVY